MESRTEGGGAGAPRAVTVGADGQRVCYLRSMGAGDHRDRLWVYDVATATERMADPGGVGSRSIVDYAVDASATVAAFAVDDVLVLAPLVGDEPAITWRGPDRVAHPRPDPTGRRVAYVHNGGLHVRERAGGDPLLLAAERDNPAVTWGQPDSVAARAFGLDQGYWWSPDGTSVLAARVDNSRVCQWHLPDPIDPTRPPRTVSYPPAGGLVAEVSLHVLNLDGGWVDVHWDRESYPYLVSVSWSTSGPPLLTVVRRLQQHGLVLSVDPRTGETQVHAELADPRWVSPVPGTPAHLPDGRVLVGGELAHDGYDARCLFADGSLLTPGTTYVRRVCGLAGADLLIEASDGEPGEQHIQVVSTRAASAPDVRRLTTGPGWHTAHSAGSTMVIGARSLDHDGTLWTVYSGGTPVGPLGPGSGVAAHFAPRPILERVTDRRLPAGVVYPRSHVEGRRLPVLLDVSDSPTGQRIMAARPAWQDSQWWAEAGFAVVVVDGRGTAGSSPSFEKVVHRRLSDMLLTDQVDALLALAEKHPDLDLSRVGVRGWSVGGGRSLGGWLAGLAVLRRPDLFHCGIVGRPIADWNLHDAAHAERYLGLPADGTDVYAHHSLVDLAAEPLSRGESARPLLLLHQLADPTVLSAHTLRLSGALLGAGRPHAVVPIPGLTGDSDQLTAIELDFLRRHLALG